MKASAIQRCFQGMLLALACACGAIPDAEVKGPLYDAEQDWQRFRASVQREPDDGRFIVEWDIPLYSEAELRRYYDTYVSRSTRALTVGIDEFEVDVVWVGNDKFDRTYCISNAFGDRKTDVITGMELAARSWSDRVGVSFRYVPAYDSNCTQNNNNVVFDVSPASSGAGYNAVAFFPYKPRAERRLLIATSAFTTTAGGRDFEGILRHELGHTLGFRHEHIWISCPDPAVEFETWFDARHVTDYDVNSVMHYPQCRPENDGGYRQTDHDYRGAVSIYGLAPALINSVLQ
jgi:hypothetical protein